MELLLTCLFFFFSQQSFAHYCIPRSSYADRKFFSSSFFSSSFPPPLFVFASQRAGSKRFSFHQKTKQKVRRPTFMKNNQPRSNSIRFQTSNQTTLITTSASIGFFGNLGDLGDLGTHEQKGKLVKIVESKDLKRFYIIHFPPFFQKTKKTNPTHQKFDLNFHLIFRTRSSLSIY